MDNERSFHTSRLRQQPVNTSNRDVSVYPMLHRKLTALVVPILYRQDMAEDLVSEFLLAALYASPVAVPPERNTELFEKAYHLIQEERKRLQAEQAFALERADQQPWSVRFQLDNRFLILNFSSHLQAIEQQFLKGALYEELTPEELEALLQVSPQRLRNIRDLCIIHLRKILSSIAKL